MRRRGRTVTALVALAAALGAAGVAWAHAALLRTCPRERHREPPAGQVSLTYSEAVEPRFAIVSVTDAGGRQGHRPAAASPRNPDTLVVPLERLRRGGTSSTGGSISVDGHPVRGAYTFAVGPNPGPAPQFAIPSISRDRGDAAAPGRPVARLPVRDGRGRPLRPPDADRAAGRVARAGTRLRAVSIAFFVAAGVALSHADLRRPLDREVRAALRVRLRRARAADARIRVRPQLPRPRAVLALFAVAAAIALWLDRPERGQRSIGALLSLAGALAAAAASSSSRAWRAMPPRPRRGAGRSLFDWLHLARRRRLDRRPDRPARALGRLRIRARGRGAGRLRSALLERRVRLRARPDRLRHRRLAAAPADARLALGDVLRTGPARQDRAAADGHDARRGEPARDEAAAARARPPELGGRRDRCSAGSSAARSCSSPPRSSPRPCSPAWRRRRRRSPVSARRTPTSAPARLRSVSRGRLPARVPVNPNRAAVPNRFAVRVSKDGKPVRAPTSPRLHDARHGDGPAGLPPRRDRPGLYGLGARARHGRPLGALVRGQAAGGAPFSCSSTRRPDEHLEAAARRPLPALRRAARARPRRCGVRGRRPLRPKCPRLPLPAAVLAGVLALVLAAGARACRRPGERLPPQPEPLCSPTTPRSPRRSPRSSPRSPRTPPAIGVSDQGCADHDPDRPRLGRGAVGEAAAVRALPRLRGGIRLPRQAP